jgi:hypothetical protein
MILPSLLEPCPICGDDAEFCPKQRRYATAPIRQGVITAGQAVDRAAVGLPFEAERAGETTLTTRVEKAGDSGEKGGDRART